MTSIDISALNQLTDLDLSNNSFMSISGASLPTGLTTLNIATNNLSSFGLSSLSNLGNLNLSSNALTAVSDSDLPLTLPTLDLSDNQVTALNIQSLADLETLSLNENNLSSFSGSGCPANLKNLNLIYNGMTSLNISMLTQLKALNVQSNQFTSIDVSYNTNLTSLNTSNNPLISLDVSNNPNLEFIGLMNMEDLTYLNLKNGNNENMTSGEPFYEMPSVEFVCVDDVATFFENLFFIDWYGEPWFIVSTDCTFDPDQVNTITGTLKFEINGDCNSQNTTTFSNTLVKTEVGSNSFGTLSNDMGAYTMQTDA